MSGALPADWLAALQARAGQPPRRPRVPLLWRGTAIGSVEPGFPDFVRDALAGAALPWRAAADHVALGDGDLTPLLARLAFALRDAGLVHAWRDEQLGVRDAQGRLLGTIERGAVRPLGIATHAVHLLGQAPDGRHWLQLRSMTKANDPGLWDTLMGGMVPARDSLEEALARESWEEAGLRMDQLQGLAYGGHVTSRGPSTETEWGYVVETIDWYRCVVPAGVEPRNQDGEVERFELVTAGEARSRLLAGACTMEAALVLVTAGL